MKENIAVPKTPGKVLIKSTTRPTFLAVMGISKNHFTGKNVEVSEGNLNA